MSSPDLLELHNISVQRGAHLALRDVSLSIPQGQHVAVLGPNGSGKSTLLKLISRELYPLVLPGSLMAILGKSRWNVFELRAQLGIVSPDLLQDLTREVNGWDLIVSSFFTSIGLWPGQDATEDMKHRTHEVLRWLQIEHIVQRTLNHMSSGEARRCLLARALVHQPQTLILDEPTTSLDLRGRRDFLRTLASIADAGHSLVLVTHHVAEILPQIERVVLLKHGRIFRDGAKADLLTAEVLSELFEMPVEVRERGGFYQVW